MLTKELNHGDHQQNTPWALPERPRESMGIQKGEINVVQEIPVYIGKDIF